MSKFWCLGGYSNFGFFWHFAETCSSSTPLNQNLLHSLLMGFFSKKKKTKTKVAPKEEQLDAPKPPPNPPPRPRRTRSKTNVVGGSENMTERTFFLEKMDTVDDEKKHQKKKHSKKKKKGKQPEPPALPPPAAPAPRKKFTLNGTRPEVIFGATTVGNSKSFQAKVTSDVPLPPGQPGIGKKHGWILFADDAFWYCHNTDEQFNSSYVNDEKVKDTGLKRTMLDGHSWTLPRASVRLHSGDVITIGAKKEVQMRFITEFTSTYWIEFDKFMNGERPQHFSRQELRDMGCNLKALTAKKGALAVMGGFKVKKIKEVHDAEVRLRELEEEAMRKKLIEQKARVLALRQKMQSDFQKVREETKISKSLIQDLEAKHKRAARAMMKKSFRKVTKESSVSNSLIHDLEEAKRKAAEIEAERLRMEAELAEQQRLLREAEEARQEAVRRAALARHRLLGANNKIINAKRMESALDMLREAQAEKLRQEAEERRKIEEARAKEAARIQSEIAKMKKKFGSAIEQGNYKKLQRCMDEMESLEPEVKKALAKEMKEAQETFNKVSSMLTVKERQELEKDRIMATKKLLIRLKNSKDSDDHYQLLRELKVIQKDEVLATAPQLEEELAAIKALVAEREKEQKRLLAALDEALESDDKDVSKKLKRVEAAKAALDAHIPRLQEVEFEEWEMRTGRIVRRLKVLEQLRALIAKLNNRAIAEMKSYRDPGSDIEAVMRGTFLLIGDPLSALQEWTKIKILIGKTGKLGLRRRINAHKMEDVKKELAENALNELLVIKDVKAIQKKSEGASVFYAWCKGILDEWKEDQKAEAEHQQRISHGGAMPKRSKTSIDL